MKRWLLSLVVAAALGAVLALQITKAETPQINLDDIKKTDRYYYGAEILRIIDGDTVEARIDLGFDTYRVETLRFYGLDAPEVTGSEKERGLESEAWLADRIASAEVIEIRTIKDETGSFGRYLAILFADGENLNRAMIDEGMAVERP